MEIRSNITPELVVCCKHMHRCVTFAKESKKFIDTNVGHVYRYLQLGKLVWTRVSPLKLY